MSKVIMLDVSVMSFKAAFQAELAVKYRKQSDGFLLPSHYTYFSSIISCLKKVGVEKEDTVILCVDDKSWRKNYYSPYKANRKDLREKHLIDWDKHFASVNKVNDQIAISTNFHVLRIKNCEADDIFSVAARIFKDRDVVICSIDSDLHQLCYYPNVKFFNLNFKTSKGKGGYVKISPEDAIKLLDKKCRKGDVSDNIIVDPNEDEQDAELRKFIVNLLELPQEIELAVTEVLQNLPVKYPHYENLPFQNSLAKRFNDIYDLKHKLDYDYCINLHEKRTIKKKKDKKEKLTK